MTKRRRLSSSPIDIVVYIVGGELRTFLWIMDKRLNMLMINGARKQTLYSQFMHCGKLHIVIDFVRLFQIAVLLVVSQAQLLQVSSLTADGLFLV